MPWPFFPPPGPWPPRECLQESANTLACAAHSSGLEEGRYLQGRLRVLVVFAAVVARVATHGA